MHGAVGEPDGQAVAPEGVEVVAPRHERHVVAAFGEPRAEVAADGARAEHEHPLPARSLAPASPTASALTVHPMIWGKPTWPWAERANTFTCRRWAPALFPGRYRTRAWTTVGFAAFDPVRSSKRMVAQLGPKLGPDCVWISEGSLEIGSAGGTACTRRPRASGGTVGRGRQRGNRRSTTFQTQVRSRTDKRARMPFPCDCSLTGPKSPCHGPPPTGDVMNMRSLASALIAVGAALIHPLRLEAVYSASSRCTSRSWLG